MSESTYTPSESGLAGRLLARFPQAVHVGQYWSQSKRYRRLLKVTLVYTGLRLLLHLVMIGGMALYGQNDDEVPVVPQDLGVYLQASAHLEQRQDLYLKDPFQSTNEPYYYPPVYAIAFRPFLWLFQLSPGLLSVVHTGLHLVAYGYLYYLWGQIFRLLNLEQANRMMALTLPVWLVFSAFWADLGFLNIYIGMAVLGTLLLRAILTEQLGWSAVWLTLIWQTKPQWAFALVLPLLLGRKRFFFKLLTLGGIGYILMIGITLLLVGWDYGWQQQVDYWQFLATVGDKYPWRTPADPFLGYNHALKQLVIFRLGLSPITNYLVLLVKLLLLSPLFFISLSLFSRSAPQTDFPAAQKRLDLAFIFYLGAFIWLDVVWELTLSIAIFPYLLATTPAKRLRQFMWVIFLSYAMLDLWQVLSFAILGQAVILPGFYIATDPGIYLPLIMIVMLVFYSLFIIRLRPSGPYKLSEEVGPCIR